MKSKIFRAGLLPYRQDEDEVRFLLMRPSDSRYGGDQFQIAKGKVEDNETTEEAAIREAQEELGLVRGNLLTFEFLGEYLGRTSIFLAEIEDPDNFTDTTFETAETVWLTVTEFQTIGRSLHLPILQDALRVIYLTTK